MEIPIKLDDLGGVFPTILGNTQYIPGTQMTIVLIGKDLVLKGSTTKIEDKQVPGIYIYIYIWWMCWTQDGRLVAAKQLKTSPESTARLGGADI